MSEFNRKPVTKNIFEGTSDEEIEVTLKIKDDFGDRYDHNESNEFKFRKAIEILQSKPHLCFFQKQKEFTKTNKITGRVTTESNHKIIVPLENQKSFEIIVSLWEDRVNTFTQLFSYRVIKFKEAIFANEPLKPIRRNCIFRVVNLEDKTGSSSERFKELYSLVEASEIPLVDINKEKDRQIWHNYVVAMKKLVKEKEQVWKIKRIDSPKYEETATNERAPYINIYIDETELTKQLKADILELFNETDLEDYAFGEDKVSIEFKNYRELSEEELKKLKEFGEELFYELSSTSPVHYISGELLFRYSDNISKEEIFAEIKSKLLSEYQLEATIQKNGYIELDASDISHLQKIISDNYNNLISVHQDNLVQLKVSFNNSAESSKLLNDIKKILIEENLPQCKPQIVNSNFRIEIPKAIPLKKFKALGLELASSENRFIPEGVKDLKEIRGTQIRDGFYVITDSINPNPIEKIERIKDLISKQYPGKNIFRKPTILLFKANTDNQLSKLRSFKSATDLVKKSKFNIENSTLDITAENKSDYDQQLKRIKNSVLEVVLEEKPFNPTYQIQFKTDLSSKREEIINAIKNGIRGVINSKVEFDVIKNNTRILFSYRFASDEEREKFKQAINSACEGHQDILTYSFENNLGRTIYELIKNEKLEEADERETIRDVFNASFVFLSPEQNDALNKVMAEQGELASFKGGIQIGKLVKKDGDRLKLRITEEFDNLINAPLDERLEFKDIIKGYIKPIFPGDLTNIDRMIRAMEKVVNPGGKSRYFFSKAGFAYKIGFPVNKHLPNFLFDPNEARQSSADLEEEKLKILANLNEPLLKDVPKQLEAVAKAMIAKDMAIIQGPPGTGKTTVIAEMIWQTLIRDSQSKILITSQTNLAVDNALERIKGKKLVRPIRIGNVDKFEDEGKVYSNDRIKKWIQAKTDSKEEIENADNAIFEWIENIKSLCSNEELYSKAVAKWKSGLAKKDNLIKSTFSMAYYKHVNVFAATCSECGSPRFSDAYKETFYSNSDARIDPEFDVVIMDESSKATPPELVLPLTLGTKVIIIGDHKQLPPMIDEKEFGEALESVGAKELIEHWTRSDYKISQFEKLFKNAPKNFVTSLDTQFRMHEQIMNCISQFYKDQVELENGLICGIRNEMDIDDFNVKPSRKHGINIEPFIFPDKHAIWVNVDKPELQEGGHYYSNDAEVDAIYKILKVLASDDSFKQYHDFMKTQKEENQEIGIITFYGPQMKKIGNKIYPSLKPNDWKEFDQHKLKNEFGIPFRINTVDKFQGMEKNIIIISTVRSNKQIQVDANGKRNERPNINYPKAFGFAQEHPRINVGFSRAKRLLIVVGNEAHFARKPEYNEAIQKMHRVDLMQIQNLASK